MGIENMEKLLQICQGDTEIILCDLGSVLQVVEDPTTRNRTLHFFHASLEDFLLDRSRSGEFWVDASKRHEEFAHLYMLYLSQNGKLFLFGRFYLFHLEIY